MFISEVALLLGVIAVTMVVPLQDYPKALITTGTTSARLHNSTVAADGLTIYPNAFGTHQEGDQISDIFWAA